MGLRTRVLCAFLIGFAASACRNGESNSTDDGADSVPLNLRLIGDSVWEASFGPPGQEARFRVRPQVKVIPDSVGFAFTSWTLYPVAGSNAKALLTALARVHNTPDTVSLPPHSDSLRLNVALLAVNVARSSEGGFGANNTGTWIAAKLFVADGDGEVYLNLNPSAGKAEFSLKDEEYGPTVLRELARVLSGT